ncbi:MAG: hypothetical protein AUK24_03475 [Syntrophaceae bacterium CG2_30_49_12]|nr:MAG: hypothetical protein AUK24_03475 [Syntrophaceae bacterium CG2_30_49_12]PIP06397.1 MAG: hypothetical protein COX52_07440 [Syntrophobacterales bacterium CG23_combo_of_CG06-09_8_20_14_all_48_27]PJA48379.1 MAG: hypothetical protein CO171_07505 [Syntrophobacterales bacterium CG_4_9_14_3_um_filter_49_8]PJC77016.1 MAG: hypothetical protein CO012_00245 [Syntrophobacterales bacterium CG_4_8_14_3_um_filter_49_14]
MNNGEVVKQARLSEDYSYIIASDGNRVEFDDPKVVHVWLLPTGLYTIRLLEGFFEKRGWNFRCGGQTNAGLLQYARRLCSGRECLPATAMAGATYKDILDNRGENEISLYYNMDQDGPCQNGAWPIVWGTFARRLNLKNVVFLAWPALKNNYLRKGERFAAEFAISTVVGDLLDEAWGTLSCLARDRDLALKTFDLEVDRVLEGALRGVPALASALKKWAENTARIPLKARVEETPKILLFGGLNARFIHEPITEFFTEQGIIAKVVDLTEGICWLESEHVVRYGFKRGLAEPSGQFNITSLLLSVFNPKNNLKEASMALRARLHIAGIVSLMKRYRKIAKKSGLIYDVHVPFLDLLREGSKYVSHNGFCETPITAGRFICSLRSGVFDGLINVSSFNCQPAMNSQAILRRLANNIRIPFVSIDCEGPWISANQRKLLETIAVQARRLRP